MKSKNTTKNITIDGLDSYLSYLSFQKGYSSKTIQNYHDDIVLFFTFLVDNNLDKDNFGRDDIRKFIYEEKSKRNISSRSIQRRLSSLRGFFDYLVKNSLVSFNQFQLVSSPKSEIKYPKRLYQEDVSSLLNAFSKFDDPLSKRNKAIIELLYSSGIRASELVNLSVSDFDFSSRSILVLGKGKKQRYAPFSSSSKDSILVYLKEVRPLLLAKSKGKNIKRDKMFLNNNGGNLTVRGLEYIVKECSIKLVGDSSLHPHELRHTFATILLESGVSLRVIQELLGHESINTTQVYTHLTQKDLQVEYDKAFNGINIKK